MDAGRTCDSLLHMLYQRLDVGGASVAMIDDEVGVLLRHRSIPDAIPLQAGALDQSRRVIVRRIGEHGSAAPLADGLRLAALVEQRANGVAIDAGLAFELQ